jgi:hypothetical protein
MQKEIIGEDQEISQESVAAVPFILGDFTGSSSGYRKPAGSLEGVQRVTILVPGFLADLRAGIEGRAGFPGHCDAGGQTRERGGARRLDVRAPAIDRPDTSSGPGRSGGVDRMSIA